MQTLAAFIRHNRIRLEVQWTDRNPNFVADDEWTKSARHFLCTLRRTGKQLTIPFSQGSAHEKEPTAADVLDCLASDASTVDGARNFEDWAAELGYQTDSRKAEKIYRHCVAQTRKLKTFLGDDLYQKLVYDTERA